MEEKIMWYEIGDGAKYIECNHSSYGFRILRNDDKKIKVYTYMHDSGDPDDVTDYLEYCLRCMHDEAIEFLEDHMVEELLFNSPEELIEKLNTIIIGDYVSIGDIIEFSTLKEMAKELNCEFKFAELKDNK